MFFSSRTAAAPPAVPSRRQIRRRMALRRLASALLLGCATWVGLSLADLGPGGSDGEEVLVANRDLPAGHRISAADATARRVPARLAPEAARRVSADVLAQGRILTAPVAAGEFLSETRLRSLDISDGLPAGRRAVAVPLRDNATAALLNPGSRVDVHSGGKGAVVVADATVLQISRPGGSGGTFSAVSSTDTAAVVLSVPVEAIGAMMSAMASGSGDASAVNLVLRAP